ncbi:hypothetical protein FOA43_001294 [Brettanomyces nanus]|uniref:Peptidase A1 domain-containing protein n=1 Tax=Eeniella nana TaxID=13502 RepID=A0A875RZ30_EENNA|nr:uncharacterized protein FOA43_001294 [Brettanomyces nanus]QPG73978.1 hypothetical protein FOA43_001294 [Brettanomyces nanus]
MKKLLQTNSTATKNDHKVEVDTDNSPLSTDDLPTLVLTSFQNKLYDYNISLGGPLRNQELRLDIANGLMWVPGAPYFKPCSGDSDEDEQSSSTSTSTSSESRSSSSSSSSSVSSTNSLVENSTVACADLGTFNISNSSSGFFYSLDTGDVSEASEASPLATLFSDYIYLSGYWARDNVSVPMSNYSMSSSQSSKAVDQLMRRTNDDDNDDDNSAGLFSLSSKSDYNVSLGNTLFIYANASDVGTGGLGVGLGTEDSLDSNFLNNFVRAGVINSNSYSLSLNPSNETYAELILGGISTDKYNGELCNFPFIPVKDESGSMITSNGGISNSLPVVPISGFGVTSNTNGNSLLFSSTYDDQVNQNSYPKPALLDSRTYYNYVPFSTLIEIAVELNAYYAESFGAWLVDCSAGLSGTLDVYMGNTSINMNISNLLYPAHDDNETSLFFSNGDQACFLALLPDYLVGYSILGTPFLRHAYLAVDNDGKQLALGKAVVKGKSQNNDTGYSGTNTADKKSLYPISSGTIPFAKANNITDYSDLTLTIPASINITNNLSVTSEVVISDGEVIVTGINQKTRTYVSTPVSSTSANVSGYSGTSKNGLPGCSKHFPFVASLMTLLIALL